jgi:hypothetical protein
LAGAASAGEFFSLPRDFEDAGIVRKDARTVAARKFFSGIEVVPFGKGPGDWV